MPSGYISPPFLLPCTKITNSSYSHLENKIPNITHQTILRFLPIILPSATKERKKNLTMKFYPFFVFASTIVAVAAAPMGE